MFKVKYTRLHNLWEAGQDRLQLVNDLLLDSYIIGSRLVIRISWANSNIATAALEQDDVSLPWQACATTPVRIRAT